MPPTPKVFDFPLYTIWLGEPWGSPEQEHNNPVLLRGWNDEIRLAPVFEEFLLEEWFPKGSDMRLKASPVKISDGKDLHKYLKLVERNATHIALNVQKVSVEHTKIIEVDRLINAFENLESPDWPDPDQWWTPGLTTNGDDGSGQPE